MSAERLAWACVALACHAALLFGFRLGTSATPRPMAERPLEVSLVAGEPAPAPAPPQVAPALPPPSPPEPAPEPLLPLPPVLQPLSEPMPEPMAKLESDKPPPRRALPGPPRPSPAAPRKPGPPVVAPGTGVSAGSAPPALGGASAGRGNSNARPRFNPTPPYPPEARRLRQEGRVLLAVDVSADGRATGVSISSSSGNALLDQSALVTVRRWTFEPARVAGLPVASKVEVPVAFRLSN